MSIEKLRNKLNEKRPRVGMRYQQYEMKAAHRDPEVVIPQQLKRQYLSVFGWCTKAVDSLADRLTFREFEEDNFEITEIFNLNNPDIFFDNAILSALIASCSFVYISMGEDGMPRLQVIDAYNATGVIEPITGMLKEGYAVLDTEDGRPTLEAYFLPGVTRYIEGKNVWEVPNRAPYPLLVPIINRPDAKRPFGHSRISRACMYYQNFARRTIERSDITAEFYSFPQKYVVGMSSNAEPLDTWKATISSMLRIDQDEKGGHPVLGQFTQPSMSPFTEQLRTCAALFAGETGLTLDDLGFVTDNPSSAEAIKASHETLRVAARKAQRNFGSGFLNVGYLAACLRDDYAYTRSQFYQTRSKWEPLFEPDAAMLSLVGDGAIKLNQAIPGYVSPEALRDLTGIRGKEVPNG